jgi:hypothetical protein
MKEFIVKRTDGDWFNLHASRFEEVLRPRSFPSRRISGWGDHRIEVEACEESFSYEDPGIHICFQTGVIDDAKAGRIVQEICENIVKSTGQQGKVIAL